MFRVMGSLRVEKVRGFWVVCKKSHSIGESPFAGLAMSNSGGDKLLELSNCGRDNLLVWMSRGIRSFWGVWRSSFRVSGIRFGLVSGEGYLEDVGWDSDCEGLVGGNGEDVVGFELRGFAREGDGGVGEGNDEGRGGGGRGFAGRGVYAEDTGDGEFG
jgi:hypothetical protein